MPPPPLPGDLFSSCMEIIRVLSFKYRSGSRQSPAGTGAGPMARRNRDTMATSKPGPLGAGGEQRQSSSRPMAPLAHHNPMTEQLLIVGKRREAAEAQLERRLRPPREGDTKTNP